MESSDGGDTPRLESTVQQRPAQPPASAAALLGSFSIDGDQTPAPTPAAAAPAAPTIPLIPPPPPPRPGQPVAFVMPPPPPPPRPASAAAAASSSSLPPIYAALNNPASLLAAAAPGAAKKRQRSEIESMQQAAAQLRREKIARFVAKRPLRKYNRKGETRYEIRKDFASSRKRVKGRFVPKGAPRLEIAWKRVAGAVTSGPLINWDRETTVAVKPSKQASPPPPSSSSSAEPTTTSA